MGSVSAMHEKKNVTRNRLTAILAIALFAFVSTAGAQDVSKTDGAASGSAANTEAPKEAVAGQLDEMAAGRLAEVKLQAEKGDVSAQVRLGIAYAEGVAVKKDSKEAAHWLTKAAEQDNALAQAMLADKYFNGRGVRQNYAQALKWAQKAADKGNPEAQMILANLYKDGLGVRQNYAKAVELYKKSAESGETFSMYSLGLMYEEGLGVEKNMEEATMWYSRAAERDNSLALEKLAKILSATESCE